MGHSSQKALAGTEERTKHLNVCEESQTKPVAFCHMNWTYIFQKAGLVVAETEFPLLFITVVTNNIA